MIDNSTMINGLKLPKKLRKKIDKEVDSREIIRWIQQPLPRFFLTLYSFLMILFAIPWTSFSLFWLWGALGSQLPDLREGFKPEYLFALFGVPFVVIGFSMLLSPLWGWLAALNTVYIVTNKRAISLEYNWFNTTIRNYYPNQLNNLYRQERQDGIGDVIIGIRQWRDSGGYHRSEELGFLNIRNPSEVETLLRQLAHNED